MKNFFKRFTHTQIENPEKMVFLDPHIETFSSKKENDFRILKVKEINEYEQENTAFSGFTPFYNDKFDIPFNSSLPALESGDVIKKSYPPTIDIIRSTYSNPNAILDVNVNDELPAPEIVNPFNESDKYLKVDVNDPLPDPAQVFKNVDFHTEHRATSVLSNGIEVFDNKNYEIVSNVSKSDNEKFSEEYIDLLKNKNNNLYGFTRNHDNKTGLERFKSSSQSFYKNDFDDEQVKAWSDFKNTLDKLI